ncbi:MAG: dipeptidase [Corynebacterium sp.]|nr:dipeptidase [Corynebacterium sp.]
MTSLDSLTSSLVSEISGERDLIFQQLSEITALHSVHSVPEFAADHKAACDWVVAALKEIGQDFGLKVQRLPAESGIDTIVAHKPAQNGAPTVLLYSHYDVVRAGDPATWRTPPTQLTEVNGRWYARGAADCKGNLIMHLSALRAWKRHSPSSPLGLVIVVEGSEEQGGAEMHALLEQQPELFQADAILVADTGNEAVGVPTLTTALRGGADFTVTTRTLEHGVHSGSFGGAAPDAVAALVRILDSFRDEDGNTVIDGVDISTTWPGTGYPAEHFRKDAAILPGVDVLGSDSDIASTVWARPAITTIGFTSTPVVHAVNAVPAQAQARLNLRVPHNYDVETIVTAVKQHIQAHTPWHAQVEVSVDTINQPFTTDIQGPAIQQLAACLAASYNAAETHSVGNGGSIPLCSDLIQVNPRAELALFGVEDPLTAIHSPNESVDPTEIFHVAAAEAAFLLTYPEIQR